MNITFDVLKRHDAPSPDAIQARPVTVTGHFNTTPAIILSMAHTLRPLIFALTALLSATALSPDARAVDLKRECQYLVDHFAIDHKLQHKLKHDQVRLHCGKRSVEGDQVLHDLTLLRMPPHESTVRIDRITGRLLTLSIERLPIPQLTAPGSGWPSLKTLEKAARAQAEIPADAQVTQARYVDTEQEGLKTGQHPYAEIEFEHTVDQAHVIGDRIIAHVDLRSGHLIWLDARKWTEVTAPKRRKSAQRAIRKVKRALKRLDLDLVPCCQKPRTGKDADLAVADAVSKKRGKRAKRRRRRRRKDRAKLHCAPKLNRRVYLHDRKGELLEAYEFVCVPTCKRKGVVRKCTEKQAVMAYVSTRRGKLLGMKGEIAPHRYRWRRPPPSRSQALPADKLRKRAKALLEAAIKRLEPDAELKDPRCPPTEDDPLVMRSCWHLMLPAIHYRARQTRSRLIFEMRR